MIAARPDTPGHIIHPIAIGKRRPRLDDGGGTTSPANGGRWITRALAQPQRVLLSRVYLRQGV
jgi:hypothetical protein